MGQKVHPKSLRLGIIQSWDSTWYTKDKKKFASFIKEDYLLRTYIKKRLKAAMLSQILIERKASKLIIKLVTARSGMVVGRGGQGIDSLRKDLVSLTGNQDLQVDVLEVAKADVDSVLIAESIATQLEKRVSYRRAMKQSIQRTMRAGAKGIKIMVSGRLGGAEIARTEWSKEGRIPLHTFRADIQYGFAEAHTVFGVIGIKVWVFHDEVLPGQQARKNYRSRNSQERRPKK